MKRSLNKSGQLTVCSLFMVTLSLSLFTGLLYLQMCIASLHENYQVGIEKVQLLLAPFWLIATLIMLLLAFPKRHALLVITKWFYRGAFIIISVLFVLLLIIDNLPVASTWRFPNERNLLTTIITSMTQPSFSGRSLAVLARAFVLVALMACVVERVRQRRYHHNV